MPGGRRAVASTAVAGSDDFSARIRWEGGELDELFAELWAGPRTPRPAVPALADVYLTRDPATVTVQLDLAGIDPERVHIELDRDLLTVSGVRERPRGDGRLYQHAEIDWGRFRRRLRIGVAVDAERATATYRRGLLTIALPLASRPQPSRVPIAIREGG